MLHDCGVMKWTPTAAKQLTWYRTHTNILTVVGKKITGNPQLLRAITVLVQNIKMLITCNIPS